MKKRKKKLSLKQLLTPAAGIGMAIGLLIVSAGVYGAVTTGELNAYITAGIGVAWIGLIVGIALVR